MSAVAVARARSEVPSPRVIHTAAEFRASVAEMETLLDLDPAKGTAEYDRLELLSVLVQVYEDAHDVYPDSETTPEAVVDFMLEQRGESRASLAGIMGGRSRVSDFFNGHRRLSVTQIKALRDLLGIPADLLIS